MEVISETKTLRTYKATNGSTWVFEIDEDGEDEMTKAKKDSWAPWTTLGKSATKFYFLTRGDGMQMLQEAPPPMDKIKDEEDNDNN